MRADPVRQRLRPGRFGERVVRRAEHRDEELGLAHRAGRGIDHRERRPGIIDEHPLAGDVVLAHGRREPALPAPVELAEPAVAVAVGMLRPVLLPQQSQRHVLAPQLAMDHRPVRPSLHPPGHAAHRLEQHRLECPIRQHLGQRPDEARPRGALEIVTQRRLPDAEARGDLAHRKAVGSQPQGIPDLPHRQPLHRASSFPAKGARHTGPRVAQQHRPEQSEAIGCPGIHDRIRSERMIGSDRNAR